MNFTWNSAASLLWCCLSGKLTGWLVGAGLYQGVPSFGKETAIPRGRTVLEMMNKRGRGRKRRKSGRERDKDNGRAALIERETGNKHRQTIINNNDDMIYSLLINLDINATRRERIYPDPGT